MKLTKNFLSVILAVIMLICMSTAAFAEDKGNSSSNGGKFVIDRELMEKEDAALKKYDRLMDEWSAGKNIPDDEIEYPSFYGGAYIDEDKNLTDESKKMTILSVTRFFCGKELRFTPSGEEAIAVLPEPVMDEESGRYIVAVRLFKNNRTIDSADAEKLLGSERA